jgi:hypothetical protein
VAFTFLWRAFKRTIDQTLPSRDVWRWVSSPLGDRRKYETTVSPEKLKYLISFGAVFLLILHVFWPSLGIDITAIALLFVAALPFSSALLKALASYGVKNLEVPGVIKIELAEAKAATDKIVRGWASGKLPAYKITASATESEPDSADTQIPSEDPIASIREVANTDPNLSLVAFRIEIEKRIRQIAESYQVGGDRTPLGKLIRELQNRQLLPPEVSAGLMDLVAIGNRAAHGAEVEPSAADWVLDFGSSIILQLDNILKNRTLHNQSIQRTPRSRR